MSILLILMIRYRIYLLALIIINSIHDHIIAFIRMLRNPIKLTLISIASFTSALNSNCVSDTVLFISSRISYIFKIVVHIRFKYANIICYNYSTFLEIISIILKYLKYSSNTIQEHHVKFFVEF